MCMQMPKGQHARLNDESDDEASAKKVEFAELTFRIDKCDSIPTGTACYLGNVPTELRARLIENLNHANKTKPVCSGGTVERDQIKGVPLQTILNWVSASGYDFRQFAASGDDAAGGYRVYLFTKGHVADHDRLD